MLSAARMTTHQRFGIFRCFVRRKILQQSTIRLHSSNKPSYNNNNNNNSNRDNSSNSTTSIFDSASNLLSSMRWTAANALTSSLTVEERTELLKRLGHNIETKNVNDENNSSMKKDNNNNKSDELQIEHTVAEAIAKAEAAEKLRKEKDQELEKVKEQYEEKYKRELESAVNARVKNELATMKRKMEYEKWQKDVENAKSSEKVIVPENATNTLPERMNGLNKTSPTSVEATVINNNDTIEQEEQNHHHHPILGKCIIDMKYKRIHLISIKHLQNIPVWKKQRIYRHDRVKNMATDKLKTMHIGLPGIIGLHEDNNGKLYILDGQHRIGMCQLLAEKVEDNNIIFDEILVEVFPQLDNNNENHAKEIFLEINKAEPIKLVDMPGIAKGSHRKILSDAAERLMVEYKIMFSTSQNCRIPNINIDNLRDSLFAANVISKHDIKSSKQLYDWLIEQNNILAKKYENPDETIKASINTRALKKAIDNKFYLGLDTTWYYN